MPIDERHFEEQLMDGTLITGGHFMLTGVNEAILNDGTIHSFGMAARLYTKGVNKGLRVGLGLLVNDLGGVCDAKTNTCQFDGAAARTHFLIPAAYQNILSQYGIEQKELAIYWEKTLRNKGKRELYKKVRDTDANLLYEEGVYWFINPADGRKIALSRPHAHSRYGIAACPLIMAAYAHQIQQDGYDASLNFYYVDLDNEQNVPNYFAIAKGRIVAESFFKAISITNAYLLKDRVIIDAHRKTV